MCYCNPNIRTICCGKFDCFPKEDKTRIQILKIQIDNLNKELKEEQLNCQHTRVIYKYNSNTGNYDPQADTYWNNVKCIDCGSYFSFDSEKDLSNYNLKGVIGSDFKMKQEDYDVFLGVQKQLNNK